MDAAYTPIGSLYLLFPSLTFLLPLLPLPIIGVHSMLLVLLVCVLPSCVCMCLLVVYVVGVRLMVCCIHIDIPHQAMHGIILLHPLLPLPSPPPPLYTLLQIPLPSYLYWLILPPYSTTSPNWILCLLSLPIHWSLLLEVWELNGIWYSTIRIDRGDT